MKLTGILINKREMVNLPKVSLNTEVFSKILEEKNLCPGKAAKEMGIDRSHLFRVMKGQQDPGRKFIAGVLKVGQGYRFDELFFLTEAGIKITNNGNQAS